MTSLTMTGVAEVEERRHLARVRYDADPHGWAIEQARLLKEGRFDQLDLVNLADEIVDVAQRQYEALESDLARVVQHLLKWDHQPERRSRGWVNTILEHRRRVEKRLDDNTSLKNRRDEALREVAKRGRADALIETDLPDRAVPTAAWSWDDVMTRPAAWPAP